MTNIPRMLARENFSRKAGLIDILDINLKMNIMNIAKYGTMLFIHLPLPAQRFALPALGRGTAKPSNWKNDKACETAWDLRRIPSVGCTLC